jgi:hypothetical protein
MAGGRDRKAPPRPDEEHTHEEAEDSEKDARTEFDEPSDEEKGDLSPRVTRVELRAFVDKPPK